MSFVFVDESIRSSGYIMCAVALDSRVLSQARSRLRTLARGNTGRIHMSECSKQQRREILRGIQNLDFSASIYLGLPKYRNKFERPRDRCLRSIFEDFSNDAQIIIESGSVDKQDYELIRKVVGEGKKFPYVEHLAPHLEPLLWLPDIIAWSYGRDSEWKSAVLQKIEKVVKV